MIVHCVSVKRTHFVFAHNFDKCQPVFIFLADLDDRKVAKNVMYN